MDESFGYGFFKGYFKIFQASGTCTVFVQHLSNSKNTKGKDGFYLLLIYSI